MIRDQLLLHLNHSVIVLSIFAILEGDKFYSDSDLHIMSDLNRGIMKFDGADEPRIVTISAVIIIGSVAALIIWALRVAYAVG